ncbi:hypothetical protein QUB05_06245 [Microcoleus sp. F10-C6]
MNLRTNLFEQTLEVLRNLGDRTGCTTSNTEQSPENLLNLKLWGKIS